MKLFLSFSVAALMATSALAEPNALECEIMSSYQEVAEAETQERLQKVIEAFEPIRQSLIAAGLTPEQMNDLDDKFKDFTSAMDGLTVAVPKGSNRDMFDLLVKDRCGE